MPIDFLPVVDVVPDNYDVSGDGPDLSDANLIRLWHDATRSSADIGLELDLQDWKLNQRWDALKKRKLLPMMRRPVNARMHRYFENSFDGRPSCGDDPLLELLRRHHNVEDVIARTVNPLKYRDVLSKCVAGVHTDGC